MQYIENIYINFQLFIKPYLRPVTAFGLVVFFLKYTPCCTVFLQHSKCKTTPNHCFMHIIITKTVARASFAFILLQLLCRLYHSLFFFYYIRFHRKYICCSWIFMQLSNSERSLISTPTAILYLRILELPSNIQNQRPPSFHFLPFLLLENRILCYNLFFRMNEPSISQKEGKKFVISKSILFRTSYRAEFPEEGVTNSHVSCFFF